MAFKTRHIPMAYIRILHQFYYENKCETQSLIYEAQRRGSYAGRVLDAFGEELDIYPDLETNGPHASGWRSAVLTPILQRQIYGISDTIASWVHQGIACALADPPKASDNGDDDDDDDSDDDDEVLTISDVTKFYLSRDPLDPRIIPTFRRNLIMTREVRWHLAVISRSTTFDNNEHFVKTVQHHESLLDPPDDKESQPKNNRTRIPPLSALETSVILGEGLGSFFEELGHTVGIASIPSRTFTDQLPLPQLSTENVQSAQRQSSVAPLSKLGQAPKAPENPNDPDNDNVRLEDQINTDNDLVPVGGVCG